MKKTIELKFLKNKLFGKVDGTKFDLGKVLYTRNKAGGDNLNLYLVYFSEKDRFDAKKELENFTKKINSYLDEGRFIEDYPRYTSKIGINQKDSTLDSYSLIY